MRTPRKGTRNGQRRTNRPRRDAVAVVGPRRKEPRRNGSTPSAATPPSDRELRNRHLRAAVAEAARLVCRLNGAMLVEDRPIDQHFVDDEDIDRRIKAGDPTAALDALTFAAHELEIAARWLERHLEMRGGV